MIRFQHMISIGILSFRMTKYLLSVYHILDIFLGIDYNREDTDPCCHGAKNLTNDATNKGIIIK